MSKHSRPSLIFLLMLFCFVYVSLFTLSSNIHGDGKQQLLLAKQIAETGRILEQYPYYIRDVRDGTPLLMPIPYPQISHIELAVLYLLGGELFAKLYSPILAAITAGFVYVLLRRFSPTLALGAGFLSIVFNSTRFIMTPLIEQFLIATMVATLAMYANFIKTGEAKYLLLSGLFLGTALASKQQGIILLVAIFLHYSTLSLYNVLKTKSTSPLHGPIYLLLITLLISSGPLLFQIGSNGTLWNVPGDSRIPFMVSKYPLDVSAWDELQKIVGYSFTSTSLLEVFQRIIVYPVFWYTNLKIIQEAVTVPFWVPTLGVLFVLGAIYILKKDRDLFFILGSVFLIETIVVHLTDTRIDQYHNLFLIVYSIFFVGGIRSALDFIKIKLAHSHFLRLLFIFILLVILTTSYGNYIPQLWGRSDREEDRYLTAYLQTCDYVKTLPEDTIFLAAETNFRYYCKRNSFWINSGGGSKIPLIFKTKNETEAIFWLKYYHIDFILINRDQTKRGGLNDFIPSTGLLTYIDNSLYFKKVYNANSSGVELLSVYATNYSSTTHS